MSKNEREKEKGAKPHLRPSFVVVAAVDHRETTAKYKLSHFVHHQTHSLSLRTTIRNTHHPLSTVVSALSHHHKNRFPLATVTLSLTLPSERSLSLFFAGNGADNILREIRVFFFCCCLI